MNTVNNSTPPPTAIDGDPLPTHHEIDLQNADALSPFERIKSLPNTVKALGVGILAAGVSTAVILVRDKSARFEASNAFNQEFVARGGKTAVIAAAAVLVSHARNKS